MLYIGADHRGFELKEKLKGYLQERGVAFEDLGAHEYNGEDDHPDFALAVAKRVAEDAEAHRGILLCGSGVGVSVAANKIPGIVAGLLFDQKQAKDASAHDHLNVAALPADFLSLEEAKLIVDAFLKTPYAEEEKYKRRLEKIRDIEERNSKSKAPNDK